MAMSKASMASKIIAKLAIITPEVAASPVYELYWMAISEGIIEELKLNMDVATSVTVPGAQAGASILAGTGQDTLIS